MPPAAPPDPAVPIFSERLWPSTGIWLLTIAFGAALGLIPAPIDATAAVVVGAIGVVAFATLLALTTPLVVLTAESFTAGRASVPLDVVVGAEALGPDDMRQARGVRLDARAYLCMRGWLPEGVRVRLADADDPTPYWLVSSRRATSLADAVTAAAGPDRPPG